MTERPLLLLPEPSRVDRTKRPRGGGGPKPLGGFRQQQRLGAKFDALDTALQAKGISIQSTANGMVPEEVLVLETAGKIENFYKAVSRIKGFEFLGEFDEEDIPPDDDFFIDKKGARKSYPGRAFLVFSNQDAYRRLLGLWAQWKRGDRLDTGLRKWKDVFGLLRDIRAWSVHDRLAETGVLEDWRERLKWEQNMFPCEIELWCRTNEAQQRAAASHVRSLVQALNGEVIAEAVIPAIRYHALATRLPMASIEALLDEDRRKAISLVQSERIQFFRAAGQMSGRIRIDETVPLAKLPEAPTPKPNSIPVVALLDGLPLQNHRALDGRVILEDPDNFALGYQASHRMHGTAMASLIIWGDLHKPGNPLPQPLYVRPILKPANMPDWVRSLPKERTPDGILIVDLVHRAVRRMFEGEGANPPSAPGISVINLSIGISDRPFDSAMSPLARLLDWLSWKYNVLFVVSAGNYGEFLDLGCPWSELSGKPLEELHKHIAKAIAENSRQRRLLSPGEAMNVLTVGAVHQDEDPTPIRPNWIDPGQFGYPSPMNAQGQGYRRSVKPEVLAPGGRVAYVKPMVETDMELHFPRIGNYRPGQLVAAPGATPGDVSATVCNRGTSNSTALISRSAAFLKPILDELRNSDGAEVLDTVPDALWMKTLLVHGARWGEIGQVYHSLLKTPENGKKLAEYLTRILGYGPVDVASVEECTKFRVTALGAGKLQAEAGAVQRFPLPPSLSGKRGWRHIVITLAWFTPICNLSNKWRNAHLWFDSPESKMPVGSNKHLRRTDSDRLAAQRGTVQHEIFSGQKAAAFVDGDDILIKVNCRQEAGILESPVPYALAVTLEVEPDIGIDIYSEIKQRIQTRIRVAAG